MWNLMPREWYTVKCAAGWSHQAKFDLDKRQKYESLNKMKRLDQESNHSSLHRDTTQGAQRGQIRAYGKRKD